MRWLRPKRILTIIGLFLAAYIVGASAGMVAGYLSTAPSLDEVNFNPELSTLIFDIHGREIARLYRGDENRIYVTLDQIPLTLQQAVIAIEDHRFYEHFGISIRGLLRALFVNIREGRIGDGNWAQGGGTITGQLARNAFLTHDRTVVRKLKEWLWAIQIERKYTKDEILETYLNEIYFGPHTYGVEAAARTFFGKSVSELDLAESALLAGVLNNPGIYSPFYNMDAAYRRRNLVLDRMAELNYITKEEAEAAKQQPIQIIERQTPRSQASYFVDYILHNYLLPEFGEQAVYAGGLRVYTTLDLDMQKAAEEALNSLLPAGEPDSSGLRQPQGAVISIEPRTGQIRAMVGGRGEDQFNRAVQAVRQPGSAIKPLIYAAAFEQGVITPAMIFVDEPLQIPLVNGTVYEPKNFDQQFRGPISVREAIERSINTIAVQVLLNLDRQVNSALDFMESLGISTLVREGRNNDLGPAIALGGLTQGVTPLEMAAAFGTFANQGIYVEPTAIIRVEAHDGTVLAEPRPKQTAVVSEETAYLISDILRGVLEAPWGTGRSARLPGKPAAGKTGTSQDNHNAWFVGYTPNLVTAVWIGNDRPSSLGFGSGRAAQVWGEYMSKVTANHPPTWFERPNGIVSVRIDTQTGLRAPDGCPISPDEIRTELFIRGTEPMSTSERCLNVDPEISPPLDVPDAVIPEQPVEPPGVGGSRSLFERLFGRN